MLRQTARTCEASWTQRKKRRSLRIFRYSRRAAKARAHTPLNIAPTQPIAIVRTPHELEFVRWGIKNTW